MTIEELFYIVSIMYMVVLLGIFIVVAYYVWKLQRIAQSVRQHTAGKVVGLMSKHIELASFVGIALSSLVLKKLKKLLQK